MVLIPLPQMIQPDGSGQGSETASVDAGEVTSGIIKEYDWWLDTAAQVGWVAKGAGVGGLRKLLLPPFILSASACSFKVTFRSRGAARSHHPHGFGEDCNGSVQAFIVAGAASQKMCTVFVVSILTQQLGSTCFLALPDGRCRSILRRLAQLSRQWSPEGNARSAGAVCARRVNNQWTSSTPHKSAALRNGVNQHFSK